MPPTVYPNSIRRNLALLVACQGLLFTNNATLIAINGLAGLSLAPYAGLATLPVTCWVLGGAIATMPASFHMKRVGRQRGLTVGTFFGIAGALSCRRVSRPGPQPLHRRSGAGQVHGRVPCPDRLRASHHAAAALRAHP